jgi:hypothetical protein
MKFTILAFLFYFLITPVLQARADYCVSTTHGCIATNPDVRQETIFSTICVPGYTKQVRPATSYTNGVKKILMRRQGLELSTIHDYELDHLIPLALGGHPRNPTNLMLQPWEGAAGAKVKDKLEVRLQKAVCKGKIPLRDAQKCIAENWISCAASHPGRKKH